MTPGELAGLCDRHRQAEERQDRRFAALMCFYANAHRDNAKRSEPFTVDEFLGKPAYNGHNRPDEVQAAVAKAIDVFKTSDNINARQIKPDDPRAQVDREALAQFMRDQGFTTEEPNGS